MNGYSLPDSPISLQSILTKLVTIEFEESVDLDSICLDTVVCIEREKKEEEDCVVSIHTMHIVAQQERRSELFGLIAMRPGFIQIAFDTNNAVIATESPTCTLEIPSPPPQPLSPPPPPPGPPPLLPQSNSTIISVSPVSNTGMVTIDIDTTQDIESFDFKVVDKSGAPVKIKSGCTQYRDIHIYVCVFALLLAKFNAFSGKLNGSPSFSHAYRHRSRRRGAD